ncbi:unnamed protein product [Ectocarpus fasciculatus]
MLTVVVHTPLRHHHGRVLSNPAGDSQPPPDGEPCPGAPSVPRIIPNHRGMTNRANDCFLLSAIQMMRALPMCHAALLNFPDAAQPAPPPGKELTWAVSRTMRALQQSGGTAGPLNPTELIGTFFTVFNETMANGEEDDLANTIGTILDKIHSETVDEGSQSSLVDSARGQMETWTICQMCQVEKRKSSPRTSFSKNEVMLSVENWSVIPPELIVSVGRFQRTWSGGYTKVKDRVAVDMRLDKRAIFGGDQTFVVTVTS